jgi:hypothetical protein
VQSHANEAGAVGAVLAALRVRVVVAHGVWDVAGDVKTGSDSMVTESCDGGSSGDGSSSYQGKISRKEMDLAMSGRLTVLAPGEAACRAMLTKPEQSVRYLRP